jgi:polyisoprenoid-binding protein YceI
MLKKTSSTMTFERGASSSTIPVAEHYVIDTEDMHAFITFRIQHLGFSWLEGRFNRFSGNFDYDANNPANNRVQVEIDVDSVDTNQEERDKHLRSKRFFDVAQYPQATFVSTKWEDSGNGQVRLHGLFTLRGVTKEITLDVSQIGSGNDQSGGERRGFEASTILHLSDYLMNEGVMLGPIAENVKVWLSVEGGVGR